MTLPVKIDEDITTQTKINVPLPGNVIGFKNRADLETLREVAQDREMWKRLSKALCVDVQGDGCTINPKP